uniref:Cyclin N-terminal domain-containing protein n=1 Tax=Trieres chinensis TaxID=1514140 RepID=A0A7S1Z5S7_TRICV|mmetsp:Transcript_18393/g.37300  ORF Transcript_18393/g.37300 Transcript_18393/m.37300 type:complete len:333 (+) Transcript_18393:78-1076(+)|eukprot:CAMPEP_0183293528 /NCGR_PEP_ID=MMETSP0160_2-20130417/2177_1 /TAXON_ID=2839 ORGANISM="Odontella Sinensis, Strain Grunow 1884" /NCGR_SAMPLE_ID=MMETSP0160_2 /ASSEMBLY_ACC=CAM_ASM_000250 /LENGTH=332 /DNA_ID=CAMNT_0025454659 /DNA_START=79 /DNA_END=1077 /DNA_ORIENTATION=+
MDHPATLESPVSEMQIFNADVPSDLVERLLVMRKQEESAYKCCDYLANFGNADIDDDCRQKMADWFYQLVDFCQVSRDNVAFAMDFLDRFLATAVTTPGRRGSDRARRAIEDRQEYQLAAMTCLYLAINLNETKCMDTALLSDLSQGKYSRSDFVAMSEAVMFGLDWHLSSPTPMCVVTHILAMLPAELHACDAVKHTLLELCQMQTEMAAQDYSYVPVKPTSIAVASVINAMEKVDQESFPMMSRLVFLKSLVEADIDAFGPEIDEVRVQLKMTFNASVNGLRQITSLLHINDQEDTASKTNSSPHCVSMVPTTKSEQWQYHDLDMEGDTP